MKTLYIASHNKHKVEEIRQIFSEDALLASRFQIKSLDDLDFHGQIPETAATLEGNALQKAAFIHEKFGVDCFSDDTGLEVAALHNRPGIYSARYANMPADFEATGHVDEASLNRPDPAFHENVDRLLRYLSREGCEDGSAPCARFRSVICLMSGNEVHYFSGEVAGVILPERQGTEGFGYDPVFRPDGYEKSFAELPLAEKDRISHRGRAMAKMMEFLRETA